MIKRLTVLIFVMLLVAMLVACRADDEQATPVTTATPVTVNLTDDEAALIDFLLSTSDLTGEWEQQRLTVLDNSRFPSICNAPPLSSVADRIAGIEAEYQSPDAEYLVSESIMRFADIATAVEAMEYIRKTAACTSWMEDPDIVVDVTAAEAPLIGDDSYALHITRNQSDASVREGDIVFVRVGEYLATLTVLARETYAPAFSHDVSQRAAAKIVAQVRTEGDDVEQESTLMAGLLTLDDLNGAWEMPRAAHRSEFEGWTGLCNAEEFPLSERARARVTVDFYEGTTAESASLMQLLVAYPEAVSVAAFAHERDSVDCRRFDSAGSNVNLAIDDAFPSFGDESFAVQFAFEQDDNEVNGYWIVIRSGERITTLIYTDPTELDAAVAVAIASSAADRLAGGTP